MADPAFPPIERDLAEQLDLLVPPALSGDFAARLATKAASTSQVPLLRALPSARPSHPGSLGRWRAIGRRARLGIAAGSLALVGLGSVSAAAAGLLGEPVNHAVHRIPVVGKLIEKVIPEKRHHHHAETEHAAGLRPVLGHETPGRLKVEPRPAVADAPPLVMQGLPQPVIAVPGLRVGGLRPLPPWRYTGPLPRSFPPGPERQAAIAAFRAFRAAHPLPPEVIAARHRRQAAIMAARRANPEFQGALPGLQRRALVPIPTPDPFATTVPPGAMPPRPEAQAMPPLKQLPPADPPAFRRPTLDPGTREQLRLERQRARIEARRAGLEPVPPRVMHRRFGPGPGFHPGPHPHPPGGFGRARRWRG